MKSTPSVSTSMMRAPASLASPMIWRSSSRGSDNSATDRRAHAAGDVESHAIEQHSGGKILPRYDVAHRGIRAQPDGSVVVEGSVTIRDLNRDLGWSLPDEEAVTVAGIVIHESQSIPDVGQVFQYYDTRFEIVRRKRNQITLLRLTRLKKP